MAPKINPHIIAVLEHAQEQLEIFCDPKDSRCDVRPAVRDDARLYLLASIWAPLQAALAEIKRDTDKGAQLSREFGVSHKIRR